MAPSLYIVIIGCGAALANRLSRQGHSVVVVDDNEAAFQALSSEFGGFHLVGDAAELSVLRRADIQRADALLADTGEATINLRVAQIGRTVFQVEQVMARVFAPGPENIHRAFNITVISPTSLVIDDFMRRLSNDLVR